MALVAVVAADLAALRAYFPAIPNPGLAVMVLVLEVVLFRGASRQRKARAFWIGFEVSGWLYVIVGSIFSRTVWRLTRSLFERSLLGKPIGVPSEMNPFLVFAGSLQFAIALGLALTIGLLARATLSRETVVDQDGKSP